MRIGNAPLTPKQSVTILLSIFLSFVAIMFYFKTQETKKQKHKITPILEVPKIEVAKEVSVEKLLPASSFSQGEVIELEDISSGRIKESKKQIEDEEFDEEPVKDGKININKASYQDLMRFLQIPAKTAKAIVSYREQSGEIWELEELEGLPGMDRTLINKIKRKVRF
ncbi:MAG: helix-hairpin-helix domain-containing protein [Elusimicrobia bacterium]|nr:helix-hairpin-helix domain-containing protein [Elusimicrobiota bacterium]